jgi:hypothetical protein
MEGWHPQPLVSSSTLDLLSSFCYACFETRHIQHQDSKYPTKYIPKHESGDTSLLISLQGKPCRHELETGSLRRNVPTKEHIPVTKKWPKAL